LNTADKAKISTVSGDSLASGRQQPVRDE